MYYAERFRIRPLSGVLYRPTPHKSPLDAADYTPALRLRDKTIERRGKVFLWAKPRRSKSRTRRTLTSPATTLLNVLTDPNS